MINNTKAYRTFMCICILFLLNINSIMSQTITGKVVDENNKAMSYVNVALFDDSTFIKGCVSNENGEFVLSHNTNDKPLSIRSSFVGYKSCTVNVPFSGDVGTINMYPSSIEIGEVVIKGNLPTTRLIGSSLVTDVKNSLLSSLGTAKDVLKHVPMLIENNGSIEVFGKGAPLIYINGRIVRDNQELAQLNSLDIKDVEVITNPGSEYDAGVNAVVKIHTLRLQGDGFSANIRATNGFVHYFQSVEQLDLKYRTKGLELFTNINYDGGRGYNSSSSEMITKAKTDWYQDFDNVQRSKYNDIMGKIGFSYMINDSNSIGAFYQNEYKETNYNRDYIGSESLDNSAYDMWNTSSYSKLKNVPQHYTNLYYNGNISRLYIDFNMDYMWSKKISSENSQEESENYHNRDVETDNKSISRLYAENIELSYPILNGYIEIGQEYTKSRLATDFAINLKELNNDASRVDENKTAAFVDFTQTIGKFDFDLGLRYEYVNSKYYKNGLLMTDQSKTYNNIFPSFSVSTTIGKLKMSLGYVNKIQRPNYSYLDGTMTYINRLTYQSGNPFLTPSNNHNIDFTTSWKSYFVQLSYSYVKDPVFNSSKPYGNDGSIKLMTYENFSHINYFKAFLGARFKVGIWNPSVNVGVMKQWFSIAYGDGIIKLNKPMPIVQIQNAIRLPGDINFNIDAQWMGKGNMRNMYVQSTSYINAKLYKKFIKEKLTVSIEANDIFNKSNYDFTFYNKDVTVNQKNHFFDNRSLNLTIQYRFNISNNRYNGTGAGNDEKSRF